MTTKNIPKHPRACASCKYKGTHSHTHHIKCLHPLFEDTLGFKFASALLSNPSLTLQETSTNPPIDLLKFNAHGVKSGWCNFPIIFDPVWVECRLPFPEPN